MPDKLSPEPGRLAGAVETFRDATEMASMTDESAVLDVGVAQSIADHYGMTDHEAVAVEIVARGMVQREAGIDGEMRRLLDDSAA